MVVAKIFSSEYINMLAFRCCHIADDSVRYICNYLARLALVKWKFSPFILLGHLWNAFSIVRLNFGCFGDALGKPSKCIWKHFHLPCVIMGYLGKEPCSVVRSCTQLALVG